MSRKLCTLLFSIEPFFAGSRSGMKSVSGEDSSLKLLGHEPKTSGTTLGLHVFTSLDCATNRVRGIADIHFRMAGRQTATIECFHSRGQRLRQFIGTKERVCIRKEFNSQKIGLGQQHGRRFIVLGHQYGRHDVM